LSASISRKRLFNEVSFDVLPGESVALLGPNGAGKSSLLKALAGEIRSVKGNVSLHGVRLAEWRLSELAQHRSVLPQHLQLNFPLSVVDVVAMGLPGRERGDSRHPLVKHLLEWVGVGHLATRRFPTLSGGEQQRAQLARILVQVWRSTLPPLLLLDECLSALDPHWQHQVLGRLQECNQRQWGVLWTAHDINIAARYADRILLMKDGCIIANGTPASVLTPALLKEVFDIRVEVLQAAGAMQVIQLGNT
jgi:iron complex transport system ATP-binding protein